MRENDSRMAFALLDITLLFGGEKKRLMTYKEDIPIARSPIQ